MSLKADLSHLPRQTETLTEGVAPDPVARFGPQLVEAWAQTERFATSLPVAKKGARFRHSDAGKCSRAIAYAALGLPRKALDSPAIWVMNLGHIVHDAIQQVLQDRYGDDIEVELKVGSNERAGHVDAVVSLPCDCEGDCEKCSGKGFAVASIEFKTVGGFAYKMAVGERSAPQGPKFDHKVQAALNAAEVDADESVIVYLSKDAISVNAAKRKRFSETLRWCAEWTFSRDEYLPLAKREHARVAGILALLDDGQLPARKIPELPDGAVIVDPASGRWEARRNGQVVDVGTAWNCAYCPWQEICTKTPAERCDVEVLDV